MILKICLACFSSSSKIHSMAPNSVKSSITHRHRKCMPLPARVRRPHSKPTSPQALSVLRSLNPACLSLPLNCVSNLKMETTFLLPCLHMERGVSSSRPFVHKKHPDKAKD